MSKIKIAIVDDDPVWLKGMEAFINEADDFSVTAMALNKADALQLIGNHEIDVLLLDINLGIGDEGIYLAAEIVEKTGIKVIMLTSLDNNKEIIINSFTAGAINYIQKENYLEIPAAIRSVYRKSSPVEVLVKEYGRLKEVEQLKLLSATEKELLRLIEAGYSQPQIAQMLYKSLGTIKCQVNAILKKIGVSTSKEAIKKIRSKGLLK